jgi:membrane peptidoglycan carboxypeptidase
MGQEGGIRERVIRQEAAEELVYMMNKVMTEGTGTRAALGDRPSAGKTGTTQAARDAWFLGFTADYVAGVWMGYDDNTPLTGVTGGGLPAEIWHETMVRVHEGLPVNPLPMRDPPPPTQVAQTQQPGGVPGAPGGQPAGNAADQIIMDVLNAIFGGN